MRLILLALACLAIPDRPLQAQQPEARAVILKGIKAQGDEKSAKKLLSAIAKAKGTMLVGEMKLDVSVQTWHQLPHKMKEAVTISGDGAKIEIIETIDGDKGWTSFNGIVDDLDGDELKKAKEMVHVEMVTGLIGIADDKDIKLVDLSKSQLGKDQVVGVRVMKKDHRDISLYFDA